MEELSEIASKAKESFLPIKSKQSYEETYAAYKKWCKKHNIDKTTEDTLLEYFSTELASYKTSSLYTKYSMLKNTINLNEGTDISSFPNIIPYLKRKGEIYTVKKSLALTKEHVDSFLLNANDEQHLLNKVILIFGIAGACRRQELVSLTNTNVKDKGNHFLVKLVDTETNTGRSFKILPGENNLLVVIRKYMALRPAISSHDRFFINYQHQKCSTQPVGIHKIGSVPGIVAKFLGLPNAGSYTGHCFRRTAVNILANSGRNARNYWCSTSEAEGFEESKGQKIHDGYKTEKNFRVTRGFEYVPKDKEVVVTFGQDECLQDINDSSSEYSIKSVERINTVNFPDETEINKCEEISQVSIKTEIDESLLTTSPKTEREQEFFDEESLSQDCAETNIVNELKVDISSSKTYAKHFQDDVVVRKKRKILDIEEEIKKKQLQIVEEQLKQLENNRKLFEIDLEIKRSELEIKKVELYHKKKLYGVHSKQNDKIINNNLHY